MLHDVFDECLNGHYSIELLKFLLENGADPYIEYMDLPVLYRLLNFFAENPISNCSKAIEIFNLFASTPEIDFSKQHRALAPPFTYLFRKNFDYLNGKYDANYIPQSVIKTFIEKGVNVNTFDQDGNNLMIFAVQTNNEDLQNYLISKGINIQRKNKSGHDAMYSAIIGDNIDAVKNILKTGYILSPLKIKEIGASSIINKKNSELLKLITDESFKYVNNYNQAKQFMLIFDESKERVLENYSFISKIFENIIDSIPAFISIAETNNPIFNEDAKKSILYLKTKYINSSKNLTEFYLKTNIFPLITMRAYTSDYYATEKQSDALYSEVNNINYIISSELKELLCNEIKQKTLDYYSRKMHNGSTVEEFNDLLNRFPSKSNEIQQRIKDVKEFIAKNELVKKSISVIDQFYWVAEGDRSWLNTFYEVSRDWITGGDKFNIFVFAKIINNSTEKLTINASVNLNVITTAHLSLFTKINNEVLNERYYVELEPGETTGILVMYQNVNGGAEYGSGLLSAGYRTLINEKKPIDISFSFIKSLPSDNIIKQEKLKKTVLNNSGNIQITRNGNDIFKENLYDWFGLKLSDFTDLYVYFDKKNNNEETLLIYDSDKKIVEQDRYSTLGSHRGSYTLRSNKNYSVYLPEYGYFDVYVKHRLTHLIIKGVNESKVTYDY